MIDNNDEHDAVCVCAFITASPLGTKSKCKYDSKFLIPSTRSARIIFYSDAGHIGFDIGMDLTLDPNKTIISLTSKYERRSFEFDIAPHWFKLEHAGTREAAERILVITDALLTYMNELHKAQFGDGRPIDFDMSLKTFEKWLGANFQQYFHANHMI